MNLSDSLDAGLAGLRLDLSEQQKTTLLSYLSLLGKWNKTYNLTAIHDPERMLTHHILDSLAIAPYVADGALLDVGSGGGFPGIPLAIARPELAVTVMDASQKKCGFMRQVAIELRLVNVSVLHARVESYQAPQKFTQIVSRAFSDLSEFVRLSAHLLAPGGNWLAMKGVHPHEEIARLKAARVVRDLPLHVPGLDAERSLIIMELA
ncbi:MAG: 16S rRNA (guanine(527)-N(7))-methyltransferase RsmG [Hydrogenophilales bacterium 28-61-23]|nr:MAG: 16S rRNA (guanine(527)-N(7))-methyltransferase RsmG [Hydrogenophilales bacterium 28-61-23]